MSGENVTAQLFGPVNYGPKTGHVQWVAWDRARQVADITFTDEHGGTYQTTALGSSFSEIRKAVADALMQELLRP